MSIRTSPWPPGTPCWVDVAVLDVDASRRFYEAVLGWSFPEPPTDAGGYRMAQVDGHDVAAIAPRQSRDQPAAWLLYLASGDADRTATAITEHGGTLLGPPDDVGSYGRFVVAADPTGAVFGVWQARDHIGAALVNQPGGMTWEDLRSTDPATAQRFYAEVFGFDFHEVEMAPGDYRTFHLPGDPAPLGGMGGFMGPPSHSHWVPYFAVASVDQAVGAASSTGGTVISPPVVTPYGRMAIVADLDGAVFHPMEVTASLQPDRS